MKAPFLGLAGLSLLLSGCVAVYKSSDIIKSLERIQRHIGEFSTKVTGDCTRKEKLHSTLLKSGAKADVEPYVGMRGDIAEMGALSKQIQARAIEAQGYHASYQKKLEGHSKVKSDDPIFKEIDALRSKVEVLGTETENLANQYQAVSNRFIDRAKQHKIYEVDVPQLRTTTEQQLSQLHAGVKQTQSELEILRGRVKGAAKSPDQLGQALALKIDRMAELVLSVEREGSAADVIFEAFKKEVGTETKIVVAPHMVSHSIAMRLQEKYGHINADIARFNAVAVELQELFKK